MTADDAKDPTTILASTEPGTFVALASDRAFWLEDVPPDTPRTLYEMREAAGRTRAVAYESLTELRLAVTGPARVLVARGRTGAAWRTTLDGADVPAALAALEAVHDRVGDAVNDYWPTIARLAGAVALLVMALLRWRADAVLVAALVTMALPSRIGMAAMAAAALLAGISAALLQAVAVPSMTPLAAVAIALVAIGLVIRRAPDADTADDLGRHRAVAIALPLLLLAAWHGAVVGREAREGFASIAGLPAGVAFTVAVGALGGALLALGGRPMRFARLARGAGAGSLGVALVVGALVLGGARAAAGHLTWRTATLERSATLRLPEGTSRVVVSPSGMRFAAQRPVQRGIPIADELADGWDFEVGPVRAPQDGLRTEEERRTLRAIQVAFMDDARLVILARRRDSLVVRLEPTFAGDDPLPRWEAKIPALLDARLRVDRVSGRWTVTGTPRPIMGNRGGLRGTLDSTAVTTDGDEDGAWHEEDTPDQLLALAQAMGALQSAEDTLVVAAGRIGSPEVLVRRWVVPGDTEAALPLPDGGTLYTTTRAHATTPTDVPATLGRLTRWMIGDDAHVDLWHLDAAGQRRRLASAGGPFVCGTPDDMGRALCAAQDARRLRLWIVDARGDLREAGMVWADGASPNFPTGLRAVVSIEGFERGAVVDAGGGRATRFEGASGRDLMAGAHPVPFGVVSLAHDAAGAALAVWRFVR